MELGKEDTECHMFRGLVALIQESAAEENI